MATAQTKQCPYFLCLYPWSGMQSAPSFVEYEETEFKCEVCKIEPTKNTLYWQSATFRYHIPICNGCHVALKQRLEIIGIETGVTSILDTFSLMFRENLILYGHGLSDRGSYNNIGFYACIWCGLLESVSLILLYKTQRDRIHPICTACANIPNQLLAAAEVRERDTACTKLTMLLVDLPMDIVRLIAATYWATVCVRKSAARFMLSSWSV